MRSRMKWPWSFSNLFAPEGHVDFGDEVLTPEEELEAEADRQAEARRRDQLEAMADDIYDEERERRCAEPSDG
jgi:hypothetical protein